MGEVHQPPDLTEPTDLDILEQRILDRSQRLGEANGPRGFRRGDQSPNWLKLSLVRKVSPDGWYQEKDDRWVPTIPKSFGLPPITSCPGSTETCRSMCYAINSSNASDVDELLLHNQEMLDAAATIDDMELLLTEIVDRYNRFADSHDIADRDRYFKPHWSGDFFSVDYAIAWARVFRNFPDIRFWVYTRSFVEPVDVLPILVGIPNLDIHLSTDINNVDAANQAIATYGDQLCKAATGRTRGQAYEVLTDTEDYKAIVCPENANRMPLMEERGSACGRCRVCFNGKSRPVLFFEKNSGQMGLPLPVSVNEVKIRPKQ